MMLRAIAWAGKRPVETLMTERPQRGGGRGTAPGAPGAPAVRRGGEAAGRASARQLAATKIRPT